eukprot:gene10897-3601_t
MRSSASPPITSPLKKTPRSVEKNYSTLEKNPENNQSFLAPIFEKSQKKTKYVTTCRQIFLIILFLICLVMAIISLTLLCIFSNNYEVDLSLLRLKSGFKIEKIHAFSQPRQLATSSKYLYIGSNDHEVLSIPLNISVIVNSSTTINTIISNLTNPAGVAFFKDDLYIATDTQILKIRNVEKSKSEPEIFLDGLPKATKHIKISPDGKSLFIAINSNCDSCEPITPLGSIIRVSLQAPIIDQKIVAKGVKNSLGFDWDPLNQTFWFTDHAKINSKYPNEINHLREENLHFGFPYCYGKSTKDPNYPKINCSNYESSAIEMPPFVHPMGMAFHRGNLFPKQYENSIFIAEHGSNPDEREKYGFRITTYDLKEGKYEVFIDGWLDYRTYFGTPTDVIFSPDGYLYISDDFSGSIYKVSHSNSACDEEGLGIIFTATQATTIKYLVSRYNANVATFKETIKPRLEKTSFKGKYGNGADINLVENTEFDRAPVQKEATFYTPLKYSQSVNFLNGAVDYVSGKTETITVKFTVDGVEKIGTFDVVVFQTYTTKLTGGSPQRDCDNLGGHFSVSSSECSVYYALEGSKCFLDLLINIVCALYDTVTKKLTKAGSGYGCVPNSGPFPKDWKAGIYKQLERASRETGRKGPKETKPTTSGVFMIRELHDPYVKFNELTDGLLDFSKVEKTTSDIGIVFFSLSGLVFFVVILFGLYFVVVILRLIVERISGNKSTDGNYMKDETTATTGLLAEEVYDEPEDQNDQVHPLEFGN